MNKYIDKCYYCNRMIYGIFRYTKDNNSICSNCINELINKEIKHMEEEILDKLEEKYEKINFKLTMLELNQKYIEYKLESSIKITDIKKGIISIGFTFNFKYDRKFTLDSNMNDIYFKIDKYIIKLFKKEEI